MLIELQGEIEKSLEQVSAKLGNSIYVKGESVSRMVSWCRRYSMIW